MHNKQKVKYTSEVKLLEGNPELRGKATPHSRAIFRESRVRWHRGPGPSVVVVLLLTRTLLSPAVPAPHQRGLHRFIV